MWKIRGFEHVYPKYPISPNTPNYANSGKYPKNGLFLTPLKIGPKIAHFWGFWGCDEKTHFKG